jgi:hypothetical protein
MAKPRWQRILDLEDAARRGPVSSSERPMPAQSLSRPDPALQQMASDVRQMKRMQAFDFFAPSIALIILVVFVFWFFRH